MQGTEAGLHAVVGLGPIGRAVIDELTGRGLRARAVARHEPPDLPQGVEYIHADVTNEDDARRALAGTAVAYHCASAPYHRWPELLPPLMRGAIAGTSATGARVIYADTLYAYGPSTDR